MDLPGHVRSFWAAMDGLFSTVSPTPWGAVVTDGRFPRVWDANYARVDRGGPRFDDVADALVPALRAAGADLFHVVVFDPEASTDLLADLSRRGHRLGWDVAMDVAADAVAEGDHPVEALADGDELWDAVAASLALFGDPADAIAQLRAIETDVMAAGGKRWFGIREGDRIVAIAALLVLEGVGYVDNVATEPAARGRGYATALTAHAVRAARGSAERVALLADPDEPAVVRMYERLGFREVGRLASTRGPLP
ncbi:MAG TPA: GNAT family N-acetyltransferase [Actinomycetota bacterium]|nr:GNAT family N-acetyltransferase [Actinomycetota bacterium]